MISAVVRLRWCERQLEPATHGSPHGIAGLNMIGHIALPGSAQIRAINRVIAEEQGGHRLSDHDAYTTGTAVT